MPLNISKFDQVVEEIQRERLSNPNDGSFESLNSFIDYCVESCNREDASQSLSELLGIDSLLFSRSEDVVIDELPQNVIIREPTVDI